MGIHKDALLVVWSVQMALLSTLSIRCLKTNWPIKGLLSSTFALGSLISLDILYRKPADSASWKIILGKYGELWYTRTVGRMYHWMWKRSVAKHPHKVQERLLIQTLQGNSLTEYGRDHGIERISTRDIYKEVHPITTYSHYKHYINRVAEGHSDVITHDKVIFMACTSGTTGSNKMFPLTTEYARLMGDSFNNILYTFMPLMSNFKRTWYFRMLPAPRKLPCGLPLGGASQLWGAPGPDNVVPSNVYKLNQETPCFYAQALFVLSEPELGVIDAFSSDLMYAFFKFLEKNIDELCTDITNGFIDCQNARVYRIDSEILNDVNLMLNPNPGRAEMIKTEIKKGVECLAQRIWPDLDYIFLAKSGSFAHAYGILKRTFLKGLKVVTAAHGGTECCPGFNINITKPDQDVYTMVPDVCFLEFIPFAEVDEGNPHTLFIDQVKLNEQYEIVTTNRQGVYRYRTGDIIKIVSFYESLPQYIFIDRLGQRLNLVFERTPETAVYTALSRNVINHMNNVNLVNYTSTESTTIEAVTGERSPKACYVIFIEVNPAVDLIRDIEGISSNIDSSLCAIHTPYEGYRRKGSIEQLQIKQVVSGTFEKVKLALWAGHPNQQFKMPRVMRRHEVLTILLDGVHHQT